MQRDINPENCVDWGKGCAEAGPYRGSVAGTLKDYYITDITIITVTQKVGS